MRGIPSRKSVKCCSRCGKPGHTRKNRKIHPGLAAVAAAKVPDAAYKKLWRKQATIRATLREVCMVCDEPADRRDKRGNPAALCARCQKDKVTRAKELRHQRYTFRDALREIANGHPNPRQRAVDALGIRAVEFIDQARMAA